MNRLPAVLPRFLPYGLLFLVSFTLYAKSIPFDFIPTWDDAEYVLDNPFIRSFSLANLKAIFSTTFISNYAPLHILSYAVDYSIWGLDPRGYHLSNLLLHGINACLVFAAVGSLAGRDRVAFAAALLFAVHPVNVENVAWVTERKTLLATMFFFSSLLCYLTFRERTGRAAGMYLLSVLLFLCALLSKVTVAALPLILAAAELLLRRTGRRWIPLIPFFVLSAAGAALVVWAHSRAHSFEEGTFSLALLLGAVYPTMVPVFWKYIGMLLWPMDLSGYYDTAVYTSFLSPVVLVSLILWASVFFLVFRKGSGHVRFWFLWFWLCILPVSNIVPLPVYYADRYLYTPAIGLFVLLGTGMQALLDTPRFIPAQKSRLVLSAAVLLLILFFTALSLNRMEVWRNEVVFWEDTVKKSPNIYKPRLNLGVVYEKQGRLEEAREQYEKAVSIYPGQDAIRNLRVLKQRIDMMKP